MAGAGTRAPGGAGDGAAVPVMRTVPLLLRPVGRAIHWTPLLVAVTLMPALAALIAATAPVLRTDIALNLLRASMLFVGAAAAFALADDMATSTAALPSPRWLRQWLRTAMAMAAAAAGWAATYAIVAAGSDVGMSVPFAGAALEAAVAVAVAVAGAAFALRQPRERQAAIAGMATLALAFLGSLFLKGTWSPWPGPDDPRWDVVHLGWLAALAVSLAAILVAHRDGS